VVTRRTPRAGTTAKRTTAKRTTAGRSTTRRRTSAGSGGYRTRRRTPRTATTLGSAVALALIALLTKISWPVRIGLVVLVLIAAAGYLLVRARRQGGDASPEPAPSSEPPADATPPAEPGSTDPKDAQP